MFHYCIYHGVEGCDELNGTKGAIKRCKWCDSKCHGHGLAGPNKECAIKSCMYGLSVDFGILNVYIEHLKGERYACFPLVRK